MREKLIQTTSITTTIALQPDIIVPLPPAPGAPDLGLTWPKDRILRPLTALHSTVSTGTYKSKYGNVHEYESCKIIARYQNQ